MTHLPELRQDLEQLNFEVIRELGTGEYGRVVLAFDRTHKARVAVKLVARDKARGAPPSILREVALLREIDHPQIIKLHDVVFSAKYICLLYEPADCDLHRLIAGRQRLPARKVTDIMYMLFQGLAELHERGILHRDLKPANVLVKRGERGVKVKIGDFGLSRATDCPAQAYASEVVSLWYRAPELLLESTQYDEKIDIWSAGCILAELLGCCVFFRGRSVSSQCEEILKVIDLRTSEAGLSSLQSLPGFEAFRALGQRIRGKGLEKLCGGDANYLSLVSSCLELEPSRRPTAHQALAHPLFAEKDWGSLDLDRLLFSA